MKTNANNVVARNVTFSELHPELLTWSDVDAHTILARRGACVRCVEMSAGFAAEVSA